MDNSYLSEAQECNFCNILQDPLKTNQILSQALFNKYSSSQDYLFGSIIENYIQNKSSPEIIQFKDEITLSENNEHIRKMYFYQQIPLKISYLTEYYKFHKEIPRIFTKPISKMLNHYYDKIRKIEYYKIRRMLHENKGTDSPFEITKTQQQNDDSSNDSSKNLQNMTKMLQSHLINSFNHKVKNIQNQKTKIFKKEEVDTILEINNFFNNFDLEINDDESQSYFLFDKQENSQIQNKQKKTILQKKIENIQKQNQNIIENLQKNIMNKVNKKHQKLYTPTVKNSFKEINQQKASLQNVKKQVKQPQTQYTKVLKKTNLKSPKQNLSTNQQKVDQKLEQQLKINTQRDYVKKDQLNTQRDFIDKNQKFETARDTKNDKQKDLQKEIRNKAKNEYQRQSSKNIQISKNDTQKSFNSDKKKEIGIKNQSKQRKVQSIYQLDQKIEKFLNINAATTLRNQYNNPQSQKNYNNFPKSLIKEVKLYKPQKKSDIQNLMISQKDIKKSRKAPKSMQLSNDYIKSFRGQSAYQDIKNSFDNRVIDKIEFKLSERAKKTLQNK